MKHWIALLGLSIGFSTYLSHAASVSEPSFCHPNAFDEKEFSLGEFEKLRDEGVVRAHAFKLGKVTLIGAGIGNSSTQPIIRFAEKYGKNAKEKKYCTWYLNHPKTDQDQTRIAASKTFYQKDVVRPPQKLTPDEAEKEFMDVLGKTFDQESINFLSCAEEQNYIALGCNEMMHRGPTVFGMLLAFSGCTPEHSLEIANQIWGLNGVKRKTRLAVIKKAFALGEKRLASRKKLARLFSE